ncbi:CcdC family protein [Ammoniphilus resinae]|uniref:Membrane protein CcdC involved in cytochrome C biogenesis n=1 Tax=Ammoniphilus resinae TaxID=861532 RepID=A0ABS4GMY5_9BACL|nr:cytochrome c biogenesis protein CcdC [Ammoniphilus resinae]MBP1931618.1 membrane protein CcdC involved in cytochrome C biogenesis [Ammoniphilus resinae]
MGVLISSIGAFVMALVVIYVRNKKSKEPTSIKKILLPPVFMSTGSIMFLYPPMQVHVLYAIESLIVGMIFSIPLILTSNFEVKGKNIFLKRSKSFIFILLGLLILRTIIKFFVGDVMSVYETGGLFYILAIGMIFPWRIAMLFRFKQTQKVLHLTNESH